MNESNAIKMKQNFFKLKSGAEVAAAANLQQFHRLKTNIQSRASFQDSI